MTLHVVVISSSSSPRPHHLIVIVIIVSSTHPHHHHLVLIIVILFLSSSSSHPHLVLVSLPRHCHLVVSSSLSSSSSSSRHLVIIVVISSSLSSSHCHCLIVFISSLSHSQQFVTECLWWYHRSGGMIEHEANAISKNLNGRVHWTHLTSLQTLLQLCVCNEKSFNVTLLVRVLCDVHNVWCEEVQQEDTSRGTIVRIRGAEKITGNHRRSREIWLVPSKNSVIHPLPLWQRCISDGLLRCSSSDTEMITLGHREIMYWDYS